MPAVGIGGFGGSGTRVVSHVAYQLGYYLGDRTVHGDTSEFFPGYDAKKGYDKFVADAYHNRIKPGASQTLIPEIWDWFKLQSKRLSDKGNGRWGFKNPESIYLLPLLRDLYDNDFKYIHVVRDGRDIALSKNQLQFDRKNSIVTPESFGDVRIRRAVFWSRVVLWVDDFCKEYFPNRYLVVRYEDFCTNPRKLAENMAKFLESSHSVEKAIPEIKAGRAPLHGKGPGDIGRWKSCEVAEKMTALAKEGLKRYGYE